METFIPQNLDPMSEVIQRFRSLEKPNMKDKDCQALEKRCCEQDWVSQLDIYEAWLDADNSYTRNTLFRFLCSGYWELLQNLTIEKESEKAKTLTKRIAEYSIKHIRMQIVAYFVATYMPIEVVRKYAKVLSRYIDMAYLSLAERLGGDSGFTIDKHRLVPRLAYYSLCQKFNIPTTDDEALSDIKKFLEWNLMQLSLDFPQNEYETTLKMSLLQNADIKVWYESICQLGLKRMAKAFNRFDKSLQERILQRFKEDENCIDFPGLSKERQYQYWYIFRCMANDEIQLSNHPKETMSSLFHSNPELKPIASQLDLQLIDSLKLEP